MNKIFYFREENIYRRLYFINFKLFKIKRKLNITDKYLINTVKNINNNISKFHKSKTEIQPKPNNVILDKLKELKNFYFLHNKGNLGDIFIANSEFQLFNSFKNVLHINLYNYTNLKIPFNFVYGGGGMFVGLYKKEHKKIFNILKNKLMKQCIILSESFYDIPEFIKLLDERFTIFCREKNSYNYLINSNTKANVYLADDMAFATDTNFYYNTGFTNMQINNLNENLKKYSIKKIRNILNDYFIKYCVIYDKVKNILSFIKQDKIKIAYLLRQDDEKIFKDKTNINSFDLSVCGGIGDKSCSDNAYVQILSELFFSAIDCADVIITDRLHAGISSALLNKEVFLFDNNYGKVFGVYEQSMKQMKNVHLLKQNDLKNIDDIIKNCNIKNTANTEHLKSLNLTMEQFLTKYLAYKN
ncbi:polysaccharide pyruvyl transferase family protein [Candidatus Ruminimicrobium bovinum]|uniref:polysaccharide pyruvyl transferase family protein n=1 Tax=Candidatus Ruminimicrobium bovinum TaxID=3242779 RepID=UPI0039B98AE9